MTFATFLTLVFAFIAAMIIAPIIFNVVAGALIIIGMAIYKAIAWLFGPFFAR